MRNSVWLLLAIVVLYLAASLALQGIYGPSYGFLAGEDCWQPDGQGGWEKHGNPSDPPPAEPSREVPIALRYLPIFLPGLLLVVFLFTPLSKKLEGPARKEKEVTTEPDGESGGND